MGNAPISRAAKSGSLKGSSAPPTVQVWNPFFAVGTSAIRTITADGRMWHDRSGVFGAICNADVRCEEWRAALIIR
jgi:hypothetical protein